MNLTELLTSVRQPYVEALAHAATSKQAHVEPAYRQEDGALAPEGLLGLPCRADLILKKGPDAGEPVTVDSDTRLQFEPFALDLGRTRVAIHPFVWDWASVDVRGLPEDTALQVFQTWFMQWFDAEDANDAGDDGLFGVVHFMSDVRHSTDGWQATVDLGSCPEAGLEDLLFRLAQAGAAGVRIG